MDHFLVDALTALEVEAATIPTGLASWAHELLVDAQALTHGRPLHQIVVEAVVIVAGEDDSSHAFRDFAHPLRQSALALRSPILNSHHRAHALETKVADLGRIANLNRAPDTAAKIQALVAEKAARYPALELRYGYIGNCDFTGRYDDRSFRVFTGLRVARGGYSKSFGDYPATDLGAMLVAVETRFDAWAQDALTQLEDGKLCRIADVLATKGITDPYNDRYLSPLRAA